MLANLPKLTIGRIGAIPIRLNITFVVVPYFLFNALHGRSIADHWPQFGAITAGILISILLHELGHAFAAKRCHVGVVEVVVGGFYGYARMKPQAVPRGQAIGILAAGPLINLVLFILLWSALSVPPVTELDIRGWSWPQGQSLAWLAETARLLAVINLVMFVFNLFPIFPLDGGKIFGLILSRFMSIYTSLWMVSGLSIAAGAAMVLYGFGASTILALIGAFIVMTNLRRLPRRKPR